MRSLDARRPVVGGPRRAARILRCLALAATATSSVAVSRSLATEAYFRPEYWVQCGPTATALAIADVNHDGRLDLLSVHTNGVVSVMLGLPLGGFAARLVTPVGLGARSLATADFDRDGRLDVAVAGGAAVVLLRGNGDGTFPAQGNVATGPFTDLLAGDLDHDGCADLMLLSRGTSPSYDGTVTVLLGDGHGAFLAKPPVPSGRHAADLATGDFDRDGDTDVAVAGYETISGGEGRVTILLGDGSGGLAAAGSVATGGYPRSITVGDLDADGAEDLALANDQGTVSVITGNGDGSFEPVVNIGIGSYNSDVALGDIDADGHVDLLVATAVYLVMPIAYEHYALVLFGDSTGTFGPGMRNWYHDFGTHSDLMSLALADVGADGMLDPVVLDAWRDSICVFPSKGLFGPRLDFATGMCPDVLLAADFTRDGLVDLATANECGSGSVSVLPGRGGGEFDPQVESPLDCVFALASGDLDHDGALDVMGLTGCDTTLCVMLGSGDGSFGTREGYPGGYFPSALAATDVNGDDDLDVVMVLLWGTSGQVLLGHGDGTFSPGPSFDAGPSPQDVAVGDLDHDGDADVVALNSDWDFVGAVVLPGNGDGSFGAGTRIALPRFPRRVAIADFDRDGNADLVVATDSLQASLSILLGNGDGTFRERLDVPTGGPSRALAVGDLDRDVKPDVVTSDNQSNRLRVMAGRGDGSFRPALQLPVGPECRCIAIADLDGDGRLDLAAGSWDATVSVYLTSHAIVADVGPDTMPAPLGLRLAAPHPNPMRVGCEIHWTQPAACAVDIRVHDVAGRCVRSLAGQRMFAAGANSLRWDGRDDTGAPVRPGVYLIRVRTGADTRVARAVVLR